MDSEILKTVGEIAGLAGLSIGLVLIIFREVIRKNMFSQLSPEHSFSLMRLIIILTFLIALIGIIAWVSSSVIYKNPITTTTTNNSLNKYISPKDSAINSSKNTTIPQNDVKTTNKHLKGTTRKYNGNQNHSSPIVPSNSSQNPITSSINQSDNPLITATKRIIIQVLSKPIIFNGAKVLSYRNFKWEDKYELIFESVTNNNEVRTIDIPFCGGTYLSEAPDNELSVLNYKYAVDIEVMGDPYEVIGVSEGIDVVKLMDASNTLRENCH